MLVFLWIVFLAILPFNLTYYLGIEHILPADMLAPLLIGFSLFAMRGYLRGILRRDWLVLVYLGLFLLTGLAAALRSVPERPLVVALAAQVYLVLLYFAFRALIAGRADTFRTLATAWAVISTLYALVGISGVALGHLGVATPLARWYPDLGPGAWRMLGTLGHSPNFIFSYLYCGFFICLGLYLERRENSQPAPGGLSRRTLLILTAVHGLALFLTYSRGILGVLLGLILLLQLRSRKGLTVRRILLPLAWAGLLALFIYSSVFFTYTTDALFTPSRAVAESLSFDSSTPHQRLYSYKNAPHLEEGAGYTRLPGGFTFLPAQHWYLLKTAWRLFRESPIFGVGPGLFPEEFARLRDSGALPPLIPTLKPHSTPLGALAEGGLVGLAALALLCVFVLAPGQWRQIKADPLSLALHAGLAGWLVVGLNIDILNFRWLWLYFALAVARR